MRLGALQLCRYGHFTDFGLDFGAGQVGEPDLHIVYGSNEAGKSTLFAAYLDWLFGIEKQSPYGFLHEYSSMRIDGVLHDGARSLPLTRIKRAKDSLLDAEGRPCGEGPVQACLSGVDREGYRGMFCLDDATLEAGGEGILQQRGEVGRLLFAATSGLPAWHAALTALQQRADAFHRPQARQTTLRQLRTELEARGRERKAQDVVGRQYRALSDAVRQAQHSAAEAQTALTTLEQERGRLQQQLTAWPRWGALQRQQARLAELPALPAPPADWQSQLQTWMRQLSQAEGQRQSAMQELERVKAARTSAPIDTAAWALADRIAALPTGAHHEERWVLQRERQAEHARTAAELAALCARLQLSTAQVRAALSWPEASRQTLQQLIDAADGVQTAEHSAALEHEKALQALQALQREATPLAAAVDVHGLQTAVTAAQALLQRDVRDRLAAERRTAALQWQASRTRLLPWRGSWRQLAALPAWPAAAQAALAERLAQAEAQLQAGLRAQEQACRALRAAEAAEGRAKTVHQQAQAGLQAARRSRDAAWQSHAAQWQPDTPAAPTAALLAQTGAAFLEALQVVDALQAAALADDHSAGLHQKAQLAVAQARAQLQQCGAEVAGAQAELATVQAEVQAELCSRGLPERTTLAAARAWWQERDAALRHHSVLLSQQAECVVVRQAWQQAQQQLRHALAQMAAPHLTSAELDIDRAQAPLAALVAEAEARLTQLRAQAAQQAALRQALADHAAQCQARAGALAQAQAARADWQAAWERALEACPLVDETEVTLPQVRLRLHHLPVLTQRGTRVATLTAQIETASIAIDAAESALVELEARLAHTPPPGATVAARLDALHARLRAARAQVEAEAELQQAEQQAGRRLTAAAQQRQRTDAAWQAWATTYQASDFAALQQQLAHAAQRQQLQAQIDMHDTELTMLLDAETRAGWADSAPSARDIDALQAGQAALAAQVQAQRERVAAALKVQVQAEQALAAVGDDAAAARLDEEQRTLLLDIQAQAEDYLTDKLGALAVEHALRRYRRAHQSDMLSAAARAFAAITCGRFHDLSTVPGKDGEILVGLRPDGASLAAPKMSKGTRFQLYLALRIAAYHAFVRQRPPLPLIADDILETFDDARAAATFAELAALSRHGQVIYLTHHPHLVALAQQRCGAALRVHRLPDPAPRA